MESHSASCSANFKPKDIANTLWAYAKLGASIGVELMSGLEAQAISRVGDFRPQEVSQTLWAYANLGLSVGQELLKGLEVRAASLVGDFKPQEVASILWAYAVMNICPSSGVLLVMFGHVMDYMKRERMNDAELAQVFQFLLCYKHQGWGDAQAKSAFASLKWEMGDKGVEAVASVRSKSVPKATASRVSEVAAAAKRMGYNVVEGSVDPDSGLSIDVLLTKSNTSDTGKGTAIEVQGPECFLARRTRDPTGSTVLKRRLLTLLGYKVTTVPYWEWGTVEGDGQTGTYVGRVTPHAD